jgi:hypothetical protein
VESGRQLARLAFRPAAPSCQISSHPESFRTQGASGLVLTRYLKRQCLSLTQHCRGLGTCTLTKIVSVPPLRLTHCALFTEAHSPSIEPSTTLEDAVTSVTHSVQGPYSKASRTTSGSAETCMFASMPRMQVPLGDLQARRRRPL